MPKSLGHTNFSWAVAILCILQQQVQFATAVAVEDHCSTSPCLNGGFCRTLASGFVCTCVNGFIGLRCERRSDECPLLESIQCVNGHCRLDSNGTPKCECNANFGGKFCDQSLNTCEHTTCNGGSCTDTPSGYKCTCPQGSIGKNCQINPARTAKCLEGCQNNLVGPLGRKCWHNESETIKVGWGYRQPLCSTRESCFDIANKSSDYIEVQLKPVQAQPNDTLLFLTDVDAALYNGQFVPHIIPVEASSTDAFATCNTSQAIPLANYSLAGPGELKVNASFLHLGSQYFIANVNSLHRCMFGLRLNVTIKENQCYDPQKPGSEMCDGHGNCYTDYSKKAYECDCCEGYTGKFCDAEDPCYIAPCKNSGVCNVVQNADGKTTFRCKCADGFLGFDCSRTVDHCESSPCHNGGTCTSNSKTFQCKCVNGYYGSRCEKTDDQCASNPCQNGGSCVDGDDTFTCHCNAGFRGTACEVNINECDPNPCHNGTCIDGLNQFHCHCNPGFTGATCDTSLKQCTQSSSLCNNGVCFEKGASPNCSCGIGYTGIHCEYNLDLCQDFIYCLGDTSLGCIDHGNSVTCTCNDGYEGSNCGVNIDECASSPCLNGGKCIDKVNRFQCLCMKGTKGSKCEEVTDMTTSKPVSTEDNIKHVTTKSREATTSSQASVFVPFDLAIVTDRCAKLQEESMLESFARSVLESIKDVCNCPLSLGRSSVECKSELNGKFITTIVVKNKQEKKKVLCSFKNRVKQGPLPTNDRNTFIVGINSDVSSCKKNDVDDKKVVHVEKSAFDNDKKTGAIIGSIAAVIIIIASCLVISVKFRNRRVHQAKGDAVKSYMNLIYQNDLELIAPKSAWSTPAQTPELERNQLKYVIKKPAKEVQGSSFSFENPGGQTSSV